MKQKLFLIFGFAFMLGLLVVINALSVQQQPEVRNSELNPNRSTYNTDPTGFHAFYTLLSETDRKTVRWQSKIAALTAADAPSVFVMVGPLKKEMIESERRELLRWVSVGGRLVVIDRHPNAAFLSSDGNGRVEVDQLRPGFPFLDETALKEPAKDVPPGVPVQPTLFTVGVGGIQPSRFGSYVRWPDQEAKAAEEDDADAESSNKQTELSPEGFYPDSEVIADIKSEGKAVVASRTYGSGSIVILTDPFVLSNGGISLLDNAQLGVNMVSAEPGKTIAFDEYHHGFGSNENRMAEYFKGTPVVAIFFQLFLVAGVILFSQSRRFARPLPVKEPDRLAKLEYLSAMAELQRRTGAYDLAVENIYREFRRRAARLVGADAKTVSNADLARLIAARVGKEPVEVADILSDAEDVIHDVRPDRSKASRTAAGIRELEAALNLTRRKASAK